MLSSVKNAAQSVGRLVRGGGDFSTSGDNKARDYAVLGGAAGVVAGATIGAIKGFEHQASNTVKETWVQKNVIHQELDGYNHHTRADRDTYCVDYDKGRCVNYDTKTQGWWHTYSPNIRDKVVGQFNAHEFHNSNALEPLGGAVLGGLAGGLVGVAAGLGLAALTRTLQDDKPAKPPAVEPETKAQDGSFDQWKKPSGELDDEKRTSAQDTRLGVYAVTGTVLGAGVGAYLGIRSGGIEHSANVTNTRTWSVPVYENKTLGHIPDGYYEHKHLLQWGPESGNGRPETVPVDGKVPVYNSDGSIRMQDHSETFQSQRYGKVVGGIAGGAIGAGVGLAAGVGLGIADKLLTEAISKN